MAQYRNAYLPSPVPHFSLLYKYNVFCFKSEESTRPYRACPLEFKDVSDVMRRLNTAVCRLHSGQTAYLFIKQLVPVIQTSATLESQRSR